MTKETYNELLNSMDKKERNEGKEDYYTFINDNVAGKLKDYLISLVYSDEGIASGDNNLNYDILYKAISFIANQGYTLAEFKKLSISDVTAMQSDSFASIWTNERLSYLNNYNEDSISNIFTEYACSLISDACAYFYNASVETTLYQLQEYIKNN